MIETWMHTNAFVAWLGADLNLGQKGDYWHDIWMSTHFWEIVKKLTEDC